MNDETPRGDDEREDEREDERPEAETAEAAEPVGEPEAAEEPVAEAAVHDDEPRVLPTATPPSEAAAEADDEDAADDPDAELRRRVSRLSRRGFLTLGGAALAGYLGWRWVDSRPAEGRLPWPLRRGLEANRALWQTLYDADRLVPTYSASMAEENPRVNGRHGLDRNADPAAWKLAVEGMAGVGPLTLGLADVKALPRVELITELRCIEGWSMVVHWAGARFADFLAAYPPPNRDGGAGDPANHPDRLVRYVAVETPGRGYYVGLDLQTALHPQTLLAYEINNRPLSWDHGAPLRLVAPIKYGIKSLKRIGTIRYAAERPADFWAERGYDWHAGH